jgi:hypothetical protein
MRCKFAAPTIDRPNQQRTATLDLLPTLPRALTYPPGPLGGQLTRGQYRRDRPEDSVRLARHEHDRLPVHTISGAFARTRRPPHQRGARGHHRVAGRRSRRRGPAPL